MQIADLSIKTITKRSKRSKSKKASRKWDERARKHTAPAHYEGLTIAEINRMNASNNLPSSMR